MTQQNEKAVVVTTEHRGVFFGYTSDVLAAGVITETQNGPLQICHKGFHATMKPRDWKGKRLWIVALYPPIEKKDDKMCSLKREFLAELPNWFQEK